VIDESEREAAISDWNDIIENGVPTKTAHTCESVERSWPCVQPIQTTRISRGARKR
jgi:hypothetical protein